MPRKLCLSAAVPVAYLEKLRKSKIRAAIQLYDTLYARQIYPEVA